MIIPIKNQPRTRLARDVAGKNAVRAYRESPEGVMVQFRAVTASASDTRIMNASLSFEEAMALANAIIAAVNDN